MVRGGRPLAEGIAGEHHLTHDLGRRQVADQLLRAGVAELAGQRAADLAGDAQGAAIRLRDVDGLDLVAVGELEQPFRGAVDAVQRLGDLGALDDEFIGQLLPEILGQIGHGVEVGDTVPVQPLPQLLGAERLVPPLDQHVVELRARNADQVDPLAVGRGKLFGVQVR